MSIINILKKQYVQTAVYWGNPQNDGYGGRTYNDPIEIKCRWEERLQVLTDENGVDHISRAVAYVLQDMDVEACLYLGTLASLDTYLDSSSGSYIDPTSVPTGMCIIKRFEKVPALGSTTEFLRKVFLSPWLS